MIFVNKISSCETVDFAACELKKYLRMMMPEAGDVRITYAPEATDGFRLGLMQDMGLDCSDADDAELDDIIYIDCDARGGIIAGDNPRSVLIAVYEYLRRNGCRWLFPGVDGEYIPMKDVEPVQYRHKASCRYRGPCIEGATSQRVLLDTIEFMPKVGMNVFQMQFFVPTPFYKRYYEHSSSVHAAPEPLTQDTMLQWKTACECEMAKRGIQFHDVGHGWTAAPFGLDCSSGWEPVDESIVPEESRKYLAELSGERKLYTGRVLNTQFCMSNPEARAKVAASITSFAEKHANVDYVHVWLADAHNNHCECAECQKREVSDWYVILLNEIDAALTAAGLSTRIVFIVYTETTWAPITEKIKNSSRFTMMIAPITRSYTRSLTDAEITTVPFVRNKVTLPKDLDEYIAYYKKWRKVYSGSAFAFEYHFWKHQIRDVSGQSLARRIFEDAETYKALGIDGMIACGSQRSYFPNGFAYYVFARKLFDISLTLEEMAQDYYSHAYGEDWREFYDYLSELDRAFGFAYMELEESADESISSYYNPQRAELLATVPEIVERGMALIKAHYDSPDRVRTVSVRILEHHAKYAQLLADAVCSKAKGEDEEAMSKGEELYNLLSEIEPHVETYLDMNLTAVYIRYMLGQKGKPRASTQS